MTSSGQETEPEAAASRLPATKIVALVALSLAAFSGNSLLARAALDDALISAGAFTTLRLASGAGILLVLTIKRSPRLFPKPHELPAALALLVYMAGFSFAYKTMPAGLGALVLFGFVQLTILIAAVRGGEGLSPARLAGMGLALLGLIGVTRPDTGDIPLGALAMMTAAGIGWGLYTLAGRNAGDPLIHTMRNFIVAALLSVPLLFVAGGAVITPMGVTLAVVSGGLTSALGYAVWYTVLPSLTRISAGVSQLLVPPITAFAAWPLLGEGLDWAFVLFSVATLAGVALAQFWPARVASPSQ